MLAVRAELERDWRMVRAHLQRARSVAPSAGPPEASHVALSLDHAYQAFESLLVRLELALGLPRRAGSDWHAAILRAAVEAIPGLRAAIVPRDALTEWEALLSFRHFLRHAYTIDLDPAKLAQNVTRLEAAVATTETPLQGLFAALMSGVGAAAD